MKSWQLVSVGIILVFLWALGGLGAGLSTVVNGIPHAVDYLSGMWPPDWHILPELVEPALETIQMGVLGITFSSLIAVPLSLLAARETTPHVTVYVVAKAVVNLARAIPTLLWAILFVTMVGLGPLAGVFALTVHCVGTLGKYSSEAIEAIYPRLQEVMEAMQVDGANRWQSLLYGLVPAVAPLFLSYVAYYFEWSVRVGTILGLVGAGGLGLRLTMSVRLFKRHETLTIILVILTMVGIIDALSRVVRARLVESST